MCEGDNSIFQKIVYLTVYMQKLNNDLSNPESGTYS